MIDCEISGFGEPIMINNKPLNFRKLNDEPIVISHDVSISVDFKFTELNRPVITTIKEIYEGALGTVKALHELMVTEKLSK